MRIEDLKVGDKVLVARKTDFHIWVSPMNKSLGKILSVKGFSAGGNVMLENGYYYPPETLELEALALVNSSYRRIVL